MTDATSERIPADEQKRQVIENAIMAFRPDVHKAFRGETSADPGSALDDLAATATVRRLTKHRRLIDGLRRTDPGKRAGLGDVARSVLASTLSPDLSEDRRQHLVDRAQRRLDEVVADEGDKRLQRRHWQHWIHSTDDVFRFSTHERTLAACNDEQRVWKLTPGLQPVCSRLIVAQFWSDLPPTAFREYVQPKYWPDCSSFWQSVDPVNGQAEVATEGGYDWDCEETVSIVGKTLTVPLQIGFRELPDHSRLWTRFNLLGGAAYTDAVLVDVDTGTVSAESVPNGPARTLVKATKYVHWRYADNQPDLTAQACDFGWSELMVEMAYRSVREFAPERLQAAETQAPGANTPAGTAAAQLVGAVTTGCQQVIGDNGPHLERLIGRFTGKSWEAGWINDLLGMGLTTARHYGNIASDVRRFADSLRDVPADSDVPAATAPPAAPAGGDAPAATDAQARGEDHG